LVRRALVAVETSGELTEVAEIGPADLLLVNDEDLTFASTRPDPASRAALLTSAGLLPSGLSRAVAVTTAWDMLLTADVSAEEFVGCVTGVLPVETTDSVVEPFLQLAVSAAEQWSPDAVRDELRSSVADVCLALASTPSRRLAALRALARTATAPHQLDALRAAAGDDLDLRWRTLVRLAELGDYDQAAVDGLVGRDPNPDAWVRALAVRAAQPDQAAKLQVWEAVVDKLEVPMGMLREVATAFWRPGQDELLAPFADRFRDALPSRGDAGWIVGMSITRSMFPLYAVDPAFVDAVTASADADGVTPVVRKCVLEKTDQLRRMLVSRAATRV
jgi:aminopeptidase N